MATRGLAGKTVVVTRPAAQANAFCAMLEGAGARVIRFPVIEIREPREPERLRALLQTLASFDIAVFISTNAVRRVLPPVLAAGPWPSGVTIAAIGERTARELTDLGCAPGIVPSQRFDSESLLAEPSLREVEGLKIVIFRGSPGREQLGETLKARGAEVIYAETYRRGIPDGGAAALMGLWSGEGIDAITVTSGESLRNLLTMVGDEGREALLGTALVVGGERVSALARESGFRVRIETADDPTDAAMLDALLRLLG